MNIQKNALIIFTRNPELGKCKTRLAKTVGDDAALHIYKYLLQHTADVAKKVEADRFVFYSENIIEDDLWDAKHFRKKLQKGHDLGERMLEAFSEIFKLNYKRVCIIGSDLLDLDSKIIEEAYDRLNQSDVVIGPSQDGGYYLLGMKKLFPKVFKNKDWGTETVREFTLRDLQRHKVYVLETLNDIDTFQDMEHYEQLKPYYNMETVLKRQR